MASFEDSAWNSALLDLSHCFTDESMVQTLGVKALKFLQHEVDSIWNKHKPDANLAAHELLKKFAVKYERRQEAFRHLRDGLCKSDLSHYAILFEHWLKGTDDRGDLSRERLNEIRELTKQSLRNKPFCLAVGKEWEEKQRKMDLRDIHTKLSWKRKHRKTSGFKQTELEDITQILSEEQLGEDGPVRILVQAEGGMGKSTELKHLAISWADGTSDELEKFDFVFHIALRFVKKTDQSIKESIEEIIIAQHPSLKRKKVKPWEIRTILEDDSCGKVLLLIDGHDEYKTGRNTDIDEAIKKELLGNCWMILTSRETDDIDSLKQEYMDAELQIQGFHGDSVTNCIQRYMEDDGKAHKLIDIMEEGNDLFSGSHGGISKPISDLVNTPILLNMICSLFEGSDSTLPSTECQLIGCIVQRCINREAIRTGRARVVKDTHVFNIDSWPADIRDSFLKLGQLAFEKLKEPGKNLMFDREEVIRVAGEKALELGLLFGTEIPQGEELDVLCFQHLMLQEFAAGVFVSTQDRNALDKLFPLFQTIEKNLEVLSFAFGLTEKPLDTMHLAFTRAATCLNQLELWIDDIQFTLKMLRNRMLSRMKELRSINETSPTLRNRDWFEYEEGATDFIPSSVFAIQSKPYSTIRAYIIQDPEYPFCPTNGDPTRYIILVEHESSIPSVVEIMKKLSEHLDIEITGVYSDALRLKAKTNSTSRSNERSILEGELNPVFGEDNMRYLTIIQSIQQYTGQTVELRSVAITHPSVQEEISELITETIHLSQNVKSLKISGPFSSSVTQHLAKELYGGDEARSLKAKRRRAEITMSDNEHETEGSSLEILEILNPKLSAVDFKCLVQPNRLSNLRTLWMWSDYLDIYFENMELDNLSLEELYLDRNNPLLKEEEAIAKSIAKSLIREEKDSTKHDDFMKSKGKLVNLRLLTISGVLTSTVEHLVVSRISRLKELELRLHFGKVDLKRVSTILTSVSQHLEELNMYGDFLSGSLRTILTGINQQCVFSCLKKLTFGRDSLASVQILTADDIEALSIAVERGRFPELSELRELMKVFPRRMPAGRISALEQLLRSCVNYYRDRTVTIQMDTPDEVTEKLRSICDGSNVSFYTSSDYLKELYSLAYKH